MQERSVVVTDLNLTRTDNGDERGQTRHSNHLENRCRHLSSLPDAGGNWLRHCFGRKGGIVGSLKISKSFSKIPMPSNSQVIRSLICWRGLCIADTSLQQSAGSKERLFTANTKKVAYLIGIKRGHLGGSFRVRIGAIHMSSRKLVTVAIVLLLDACASSAPPPQHFRTPVRPDPANPIQVGEDYYPIESRKIREEGECRVKVHVDITGAVHDPEIVASTGFPRLDRACLSVLRAAHLLPATEDGQPVEATAVLPLIWSLSGNWVSANPVPSGELPGLSRCANTRMYTLPPIEKEMPIGADRALQSKPVEPISVMLELAVSSVGFISDFAVLKSSGSESMDEQAIVIARRLKLTAAIKDGAPVESCARLAVVWSAHH
jgi:TonB family protein